MGLFTFSEMQSDVRSMLGGRTNQEALIMRGLIYSQWRIARIFHFDEQFVNDEVTLTNTGAGNEVTDATITMPTGTRKIHSLSIVDSTRNSKLMQIGADKWEEVIGATDSHGEGEPSKYVQYGNTVIVWRVPDGTYTVRRLYSVWATEIALNAEKTAPSDTAAVSLLEHKDDLITMYATVWCYLTMGNREKANYYYVVFKDMLGEAGVDDLQKPDLVIASSTPNVQIYDHSVPFFGS